jgi:hypothetical protein
MIWPTKVEVGDNNIFLYRQDGEELPFRCRINPNICYKAANKCVQTIPPFSAELQETLHSNMLPPEENTKCEYICVVYCTSTKWYKIWHTTIKRSFSRTDCNHFPESKFVLEYTKQGMDCCKQNAGSYEQFVIDQSILESLQESKRFLPKADRDADSDTRDLFTYSMIHVGDSTRQNIHLDCKAANKCVQTIPPFTELQETLHSNMLPPEENTECEYICVVCCTSTKWYKIWHTTIKCYLSMTDCNHFPESKSDCCKQNAGSYEQFVIDQSILESLQDSNRFLPKADRDADSDTHDLFTCSIILRARFSTRSIILYLYSAQRMILPTKVEVGDDNMFFYCQDGDELLFPKYRNNPSFANNIPTSAQTSPPFDAELQETLHSNMLPPRLNTESVEQNTASTEENTECEYICVVHCTSTKRYIIGHVTTINHYLSLSYCKYFPVGLISNGTDCSKQNAGSDEQFIIDHQSILETLQERNRLPILPKADRDADSVGTSTRRIYLYSAQYPRRIIWRILHSNILPSFDACEKTRLNTESTEENTKCEYVCVVHCTSTKWYATIKRYLLTKCNHFPVVMTKQGTDCSKQNAGSDEQFIIIVKIAKAYSFPPLVLPLK